MERPVDEIRGFETDADDDFGQQVSFSDIITIEELERILKKYYPYADKSKILIIAIEDDIRIYEDVY